jgi:hypothetical protein
VKSRDGEGRTETGDRVHAKSQQLSLADQIRKGLAGHDDVAIHLAGQEPLWQRHVFDEELAGVGPTPTQGEAGASSTASPASLSSGTRSSYPGIP